MAPNKVYYKNDENYGIAYLYNETIICFMLTDC